LMTLRGRVLRYLLMSQPEDAARVGWRAGRILG
jgi:hypothetical protein